MRQSGNPKKSERIRKKPREFGGIKENSTDSERIRKQEDLKESERIRENPR